MKYKGRRIKMTSPSVTSLDPWLLLAERDPPVHLGRASGDVQLIQHPVDEAGLAAANRAHYHRQRSLGGLQASKILRE